MSSYFWGYPNKSNDMYYSLTYMPNHYYTSRCGGPTLSIHVSKCIGDQNHQVHSPKDDHTQNILIDLFQYRGFWLFGLKDTFFLLRYYPPWGCGGNDITFKNRDVLITLG